MSAGIRLFIVRHGQSEANVAGTLGGHTPTPLTELGRSQARAIGERLQSAGVDLIISSDLERARQTTEEISRFVPARVLFDARLRERTWGVLDTQKVGDFRTLCQQSGQPYHVFKPENGESLLDVEARARSLIEFIINESGSSVIALSGHHTINKSLLFALLGYPWHEWENVKQDNTCLNELHINSDRSVQLIRLNCTEHLATLEG